MKFTRVPVIAAALAAVLASTTGYCVLQKGYPLAPPSAPASLPPVHLLPEAVVPYPLSDIEPRDAPDKG